MANDPTDQPTTPQPSAAGGSKDVLFGWLVGRAAADLGLAQALAASEAQRAEQFQALEAGLLAQIRELRNAPSAFAAHPEQTEEFARLKAEMQSLLERMGGCETAAERFVQTPEILRGEIARLQAQLGERQGAAEMQNSQLAKALEALSARMDQWDHRQAAELAAIERAAGETSTIQSALRPLADRLAQLELASRSVETRLAEEIARSEQLGAERLQSALATLKSETLAGADNLSEETLARRFEQMAQSRFGELPARVEQTARSLNRLAADHATLRAELENLSKQFAGVAAAPGVDFAAERERWSGAIEARLGEVAESIRRETRAANESKADRESVAAECAGLAERLARVETAVDHAALSMGQELTAMRGELDRRERELQPAAELLRGLEETLRAEIAAIQEYLGREQQNARARELQQREFETQLQRLGQRLKETESTVQQTHALVVNESAQAAQQREMLTAELAALRAETGAAQGRADLERFEENLREKIHALHTQLAQHAGALARRDDELRELKAQMENLAEQALRSEDRPAPPLALPERIGAGAALDAAMETARESRPSAPLGLAAAAQETRPAMAANGGWEAVLTEARDPLKTLHERMSADIERARAELREKSGRWKLRR